MAQRVYISSLLTPSRCLSVLLLRLCMLPKRPAPSTQHLKLMWVQTRQENRDFLWSTLSTTYLHHTAGFSAFLEMSDRVLGRMRVASSSTTLVEFPWARRTHQKTHRHTHLSNDRFADHTFSPFPLRTCVPDRIDLPTCLGCDQSDQGCQAPGGLRQIDGWEANPRSSH